MEITIKEGTFKIMDRDKLQRVLEGTTNAKGQILAGLGEDALKDNPLLVLSIYDKIGGYITGKDGAKVEMGSFYDFKKRTPRAVPSISYAFRVNGEAITMKEGDEEPLEIKAVKLANLVKKKKAAAK